VRVKRHQRERKREGGKVVLGRGGTFGACGPGILICEKATHFSITNNVFQPSPFEPITDLSAVGASKVIQGNLMRKIESKKD